MECLKKNIFVSTALIAAIGVAVSSVWNAFVPEEKRVSYLTFDRKVELEKEFVASRDNMHQELKVQNHKQVGKVIDVFIFFSSECDECRFVRDTVIPEMIKTFGNTITVHQCDTQNMSAYQKLLEFERKHVSKEDATVKLFVGNNHLAGAQEIAKKGISVIRNNL